MSAAAGKYQNVDCICSDNTENNKLTNIIFTNAIHIEDDNANDTKCLASSLLDAE